MTTEDGRMLQIIREYRANINDPESNWPKIEFERASYSKWAVDEIIRLIMENPEVSVLATVNNYKNMMYQFAKNTSCYHEDVKFIFELAWEVASDIEDQITGI